ncbi:hypothetical protein PVL29_008406 [Vitis rotundifolia]|uniref:FLZ-type domain-containing protein n=1 Tax=Vitis rotundifolia TaxID=103349 RepID=A0AA38ZWK6_VITRO|nr:hypothetical protein PVL29_008406 [Vitis rotundifolia]
MHFSPPLLSLSLLCTILPLTCLNLNISQMSMKRPRVGRSSSFDDASFLSQVSPLAMGSPDLRWEKHSAIAAETASANGASDSAKILKPSELVADHQSRPKILTVASPETVKGKFDESFEGPIGGFLQKCYYCKKKIHENAEVFMYGYLHAFCTSECRDRQIIFDKELEKASAKPIEAMNEHRRVNRMKNQFGFQLEKKAAP